jgi:hypothetical protein
LRNYLLVCLAAVAWSVAVPQAMSQEPVDCTDCHEPAEDWEGLSVDEIIVLSRGPDNKRHLKNDALSDEQLRALIISIMN